jgi:hypothetical protein
MLTDGGVVDHPADPDEPDPETPFDLCEIDDDVEQRPAPREALGPVGQLIATLGIAALLGLLIVGVLGALSWLFA